MNDDFIISHKLGYPTTISNIYVKRLTDGLGTWFPLRHRNTVINHILLSIRTFPWINCEYSISPRLAMFVCCYTGECFCIFPFFYRFYPEHGAMWHAQHLVAVVFLCVELFTVSLPMECGWGVARRLTEEADYEILGDFHVLWCVGDLWGS